MQLKRIDLPGKSVVTGYRNGGFRVAGQDYEGSLLLWEETLHQWPVTAVEEITLDALSPLLDAADPPDFIIFGTGSALRRLPSEVDAALKKRGIAVETMDTGAASRTYSFLATEGRRVAGALIAL